MLCYYLHAVDMLLYSKNWNTINMEVFGELVAVWVDIDIIDSRGGQASVCSEKLMVTPKTFAPGQNKEEFL